MAYRYRLELVLKYRRDLEEMAQQKFARQQVILDTQQKRLEDLRLERRRMMADFELRKAETILAPLFAAFVESLSFRESDIESQAEVVKAQQKVVAEAREELAEKMKKRKVLEKARERDYQKYVQEEVRQDQKENDEMMVLRYGRRNGLGK